MKKANPKDRIQPANQELKEFLNELGIYIGNKSGKGWKSKDIVYVWIKPTIKDKIKKWVTSGTGLSKHSVWIRFEREKSANRTIQK